MKIDYSPPKQSYVNPPQSSGKQRKESTGTFTSLLLIISVITFAVGFGTGWFFSQKAAKRSFQAATEQKSLESSPQPEPVAQKTTPAVQAPGVAPQVPATATADQQAQGTVPAPHPETPLSFYKNLPSGQKSEVLGSGKNSKDDKAKQPLQAVIPSNLTKPSGADTAKPAAPEKPSSGDKPASKIQDTAFSVQVASFPLKSEAEPLKNKLAAKGYNAFIVESNQGDKGVWYRVRVGKKLEQDAAKELAAKLGKGALVIPDRE